MKLFALVAALSISSCSIPHEPKGKADAVDDLVKKYGGPGPSELFRLRAECANQARQFEVDWRKHLGQYYGFSVFRNHYNQEGGRCYVHILAGNDFGHYETVMDATEGIGGAEIAWRKVLNDKSPVKLDEKNFNSQHDDSKTIAEIRRLMEDIVVDQSGVNAPLSSFERK